MNFQEIKYFSASTESTAHEKLNPDTLNKFDLYLILRASIDFDRVVSFREHPTNAEVSIIEMMGATVDYMVPMKYDNFKSFFEKKTNTKEAING